MYLIMIRAAMNMEQIGSAIIQPGGREAIQSSFAIYAAKIVLFLPN